MFRKVFKSISKALSSKEEAAPPAAAVQPPAAKPAPAAKAPAQPEKSKGKAPEKAKSKAPEIAPAPPVEPAPVLPQKTPEELCEITSKMSKEEIKARLAFLYRRFNRATSSLDPKLRAEADVMLDAIVAVREKVFGAL